MTRAAYELVVVFVFRRMAGGAEFFMLRRSADDYLGGTWQPVSGEIHAGETAARRAREMLEETGLRPRRFFQADSVMTFYVAEKDAVYHCPTFAAEVATEDAVTLNKEHDAFEWVDVLAAIPRFMWPGQRHVAREIWVEIIEGGPATPYLEISLTDE